MITFGFRSSPLALGDACTDLGARSEADRRHPKCGRDYPAMLIAVSAEEDQTDHVLISFAGT